MFYSSKEFFQSSDEHREKRSIDTKYKDEYSMEIRAVELCCQHRTHCFVHDSFGVLKIFFLALIIKFIGSFLFGFLTMKHVALVTILK